MNFHITKPYKCYLRAQQLACSNIFIFETNNWYNLSEKTIADFLSGKPQHTIELYNHFISMFQSIGVIEVSAAKTMIGISNTHKRIAWVTQLGKNFIHVVFPFKSPHQDNLCFTKIALVPGSEQYNHHFRMLYTADINDEVLRYMQLAYDEAE